MPGSELKGFAMETCSYDECGNMYITHRTMTNWSVRGRQVCGLKCANRLLMKLNKAQEKEARWR